MNKITPVILCGGSGTRLLPLSRAVFPKQFLVLSGTAEVTCGDKVILLKETNSPASRWAKCIACTIQAPSRWKLLKYNRVALWVRMILCGLMTAMGGLCKQ
jgi:hypothetical protein